MGHTVALPFQFPEGHAPEVAEVRSTLLAASLRVIRERGWESRYFAKLPAPLHEEVQLLTAGVWVPISLALSHYRACDAMSLTSAELDEIGEDVSMRTQRAFIGTLGKAASNAGFGPWHFLKSSHRIWSRMMNGGDTCIYEVGPKEALVVLVGCPLVEIAYFRLGLVTYYRAIAKVLSKVVYTREVREHRRTNEIGFRISWA